MKNQTVTSCSIGGLHHLSYSDWGDQDNPHVLVCAHGLTRNKHDFDLLASRLAPQRRVICFDLPGRGNSDWLTNKLAYDYNQYVIDAMIILSRIGVKQVDWLGTSMGGILGLLISASNKTPIKRLILNDVGPLIPKQALIRIADYVGQQPSFDNTDQLEEYMREIYAGFGNLSDEQWQHILKYGQRHLDNGHFTLNYDPGLSQAFNKKPQEDINLWPIWQSIKQPTLIIRGEHSDLLSSTTVEEMLQSNTKAQQVVIPDAGHAPALMSENEFNIIDQWLNSTH